MAARSLIAGIAALVLVIATVAAGQNYLESTAAKAAGAAPSVPQTAILTVTRNLAAGTRIAAGDVEWRAWPQSGVAADHITKGQFDLAHFAGQVVRSSLLAGEPVTSARLIAAGDRSTLAAVTGEGLRAVSIAVNATSGVSGLIAPGDRVDVLISYAVPGAPSPDGSARDSKAVATVMRDVRVVAVDQAMATGTASADIHNASLEVTPKQAELLTLASDIGKLTLALRSVRRQNETELPLNKPTIDHQIGLLLPARSAVFLSRAVTAASSTAAGPSPTAPARGAPVELRGSADAAAPAAGAN